jgi:pimeloyl-ACP methyl ester carboxylesterase
MPHLLFVHGLFVTARCFDKFRSRAESRGYSTSAPPWPYLDGDAAHLRANPPAGLTDIGLGELVAHYSGHARAFDTPPVLIGHSLGGMIVQVLADRGLGAAAVALDPAPIRGVRAAPQAVRVNLPILLRWRGHRRLFLMKRTAFARNFANGLPADQVDAAYDDVVVHAPGKPFLQLALGDRARHTETRPRPEGKPVLLVAGDADRTVPASMVRATHARYLTAGAPAELLPAPGHSHYLIAEPGWEKIADSVLDWVARTVG